MGQRRHRPEHVFFVRPCERCGITVDYCGSCQPGRLYCRDGCSEIAREESVRLAHVKFNDRGSEEGLEVHRLEEQERRDRRTKESKEPEDPEECETEAAHVGDHRCHEETSELQVPSSAVTKLAAEILDDASPRPARAARAAIVEWVLVAAPQLLAGARNRLGSEAICPFCGRRGRVVRVVSLEQWRRRPRRGFG